MNTKFHDLIIINKPDKIYVPIDITKDYTVIPKMGEYVYKASLIAHTKGEIKEEIYSPISGKYIETIKNDNGKYLIIENDYKEMNEELRGINKDIYNASYETFIQRLKESSIKDNNEGIYVKYIDSNKKTILIDCFNNNCLYNKYIIENSITEILEIIDAICNINKLNGCIFIINKKDKKLRKLLEQRIGTYLNFKIAGISIRKEENRISIINKKNKINDQYIVENIKNLVAIKNILKYNMPYIEKIIILHDNKNYIPLKVKIGTKINFILTSLNISIDKYILKTCNENMEISNQDIVVDNSINEIVI